MIRGRRYNDTSHDCDAVCDKLEVVVDSISELDQTAHSVKMQLDRIATALEKLAGLPSVSTVGTLA